MMSSCTLSQIFYLLKHLLLLYLVISKQSCNHLISTLIMILYVLYVCLCILVSLKIPDWSWGVTITLHSHVSLRVSLWFCRMLEVGVSILIRLFDFAIYIVAIHEYLSWSMGGSSFQKCSFGQCTRQTRLHYYMMHARDQSMHVRLRTW
jgi:hypothetical protein